MKQVFFFLILLFDCFSSFSQDMDSMNEHSQNIDLSISTPQPRMNQSFKITLDINHVRATIFQQFGGKVQPTRDINLGDVPEMTMNVMPVKKGPTEIGPLQFILNNTKYISNKVSFDVVDALPDTDEGVWIRKVNVEGDKICIIIEQRIPASNVTVSRGNETTINTFPETESILRFKDSYSIPGLSGVTSSSVTNYESVTVDGKEKQFLSAYATYYFHIDDKKSKIKITKDVFENIPRGYHFNDIIVQ